MLNQPIRKNNSVRGGKQSGTILLRMWSQSDGASRRSDFVPCRPIRKMPALAGGVATPARMW